MRKLGIILSVIFMRAHSFAVIAYVGGNLQVAQSGDPFTTSAYIGTAGSLMAISVFWKGAVTISGVTSSAGTCVDSGAGRLVRPTDGFLQIFYCANIVGGSFTYAVDFSGTPTSGETHVFKDEFSGVALVTPVEATNTGTATSGSVATTGNLVLGNANDVIYAFAVGNNAALYTVGTNFTQCQLEAAGQAGSEYRLVTPGTFTASMNFPGGVTKAGIIGVAFKAFAADVSSSTILRSGTYYGGSYR